jgi:hypothetical protein
MTKKNKVVLGPDSPTHKRFLDCTSDYVIFGGKQLCLR